MNSAFAYVSGKIEVRQEGCFVEGRKIDCPQEGQSLLERPFLQGGVFQPSAARLDLLPPNPALEVRHDFFFLATFFLVVVALAFWGLTKSKIFGLTLAGYLRPIWPWVLLALAVVFWQYVVGVTLAGDPPWLRVSQLIWELAVAASVYQMLKTSTATYGRLFVLGVLYSLLIHGLKVTIRYFFYAQTLWYVADRLLYGSLLVMLLTVGLGFLLLFFQKRGSANAAWPRPNHPRADR
jgi:hypothetical protein